MYWSVEFGGTWERMKGLMNEKEWCNGGSGKRIEWLWRQR
jgi:hypothetical protein